MPEKLDRIGVKMLRLLQGNGRLSNAELAQLVGISPATCHRRTQSLFEEGYISRVRAMIVPQKVDRAALVMVGVVLDRSTPESFAAFEKAVAKLKFILDFTWSRATSITSLRSGSGTWRTSTGSTANS